MLTFQNLSSKQTSKILTLNEKVQFEEGKAKKFAAQLIPELEKQTKAKIFDDYNLSFNLKCFETEENLNYKTEIPSLLHLEEEFSLNWNEVYFTKDTLLEKTHIGYIMHHILFDAILPLEKILMIEDVWIEVTVEYQFFTLKVE